MLPVLMKQLGGVLVLYYLPRVICCRMELATMATMSGYWAFSSHCVWLVLLLVTSALGDIESTNPGPVRYPCTVCAKPIRVNQPGVTCNL